MRHPSQRFVAPQLPLSGSRSLTPLILNWEHLVPLIEGVNRILRIRFGYSSPPGKAFWYIAALFTHHAGTPGVTNPTLSWQEFAEREAPGLTRVEVQQSESKDTQGIHGLVVLQEIQDPIWTNAREVFIKIKHP